MRPREMKRSQTTDAVRDNKIHSQMLPYEEEKNMVPAGERKPIPKKETNETDSMRTEDVKNQNSEVLPMEEYSGSMKDGYTLQPVIVEAQRPEWENQLSPGTVSVINVPKYEGEQKTFADLLETVPGVYIDRLFGGGKGHYTTVRIRGSSASQVSIYMDEFD